MTIWNQMRVVLTWLGLILIFLVPPIQAQNISDDGVRLVGRFHGLPNEITAEWPGSLIEIRFEGARLDVTISDSGNNRLIVEIDGKPRPLEMKSGKHTYSVLDDESPANHTVRLIKGTESAFGRTSVTGIWTDGKFMLPIPGRRRMLVLGDSISAGYGVEGPDTECGFEATFENQYLTYAAVVARTLDADVVTLAVSGAGLIRNYNGDTTTTMAQLLYRLLPSYSLPAPLPSADVVVVHLGTNDFADGARPSGFIDAYEALLKDVRSTSPEAMIYAAMGPMLRSEDQDAAVAAITAAVAARHRKRDDNVAMIRFGRQTDFDDLGCDWHPNVKAHTRMAIELEQRIREDVGWGEPN